MLIRRSKVVLDGRYGSALARLSDVSADPALRGAAMLDVRQARNHVYKASTVARAEVGRHTVAK